MAVLWADGFDEYGSVSDMSAFYTGTANALGNGATFTPFNAGQSCSFFITAPTATFYTATNEATVYGSLRVYGSTTGATNYTYITFNDGANAQCTIRFNMDNSISLYSGGPSGTLLTTYTSAYTSTSWNSCQFKVVINNSTGSIELRLNGATSDTYSLTSVNTRAGSSNNYCNGFAFGGGEQSWLDDLFLNNTSGNAPTSWPGDMRAIQQTPVIATQTNFSLSPATSSQSIGGSFSTTSQASGATLYNPFTMTIPGKVASVAFVLNAGITGHVNVAIYDNTGAGGGPGNVLGSQVVTNPTTGANTATFGSPISVTNGSTYYVGYDQDTTTVYTGYFISNSYSGTTTYGSFPVSNPSSLTGPTSTISPEATITFDDDNATGIYELHEDGDTSYIYTVSVMEDKYSLSQIAATYTVVAMQYYACWRRADAGARTAQISIAANGSGDTALVSSNSIGTSYAYVQKVLELDPTSAAWTTTSVNGAILGLAVTA